jgi:hypothetical protein
MLVRLSRLRRRKRKYWLLLRQFARKFLFVFDFFLPRLDTPSNGLARSRERVVNNNHDTITRGCRRARVKVIDRTVA